MDIFKQNNLLKRLLGLLVMMNLFLLIILFYRRPPLPDTVRPKNPDQLAQILKEELALSDPQAESLQTIRNHFFEQEEVLSERIKQCRDEMNQLMFSSKANVSRLDTLARQVAALEYRMEKLRIAQAQEIQQVCNPAQLDKMQQLVKEVRDYLKPQKHENTVKD